MKFIDEVSIVIASGHGGPGKSSFRREAMTPRGGADGGDGGRGGDVIFRTSKHINSLVDYRRNKKYSAKDGTPGGTSNMTGANAEDLILIVPQGTVIRNAEGEIIADLTGSTDYVALRGGRGGKGNAFFTTSVNQAPEHAQPGEDGETLEVSLELKLLADVGIIGFPNAGKSTLISRISAAKPKIADYPFTTLTPHLGVVKVADFKSFVVADIPGLVKGAHLGIGLGIQFLKHIERTKIFIHVIDITGMSGQTAVQDYQDINHELAAYDEANKDKDGFFPLSTRKQIVALNKVDSLPKEEVQKIAKKFEKETGVTPYCISAVAGMNVKDLIQVIGDELFKSHKEDEV
jgi:GTP-binding protein